MLLVVIVMMCGQQGLRRDVEIGVSVRCGLELELELSIELGLSLPCTRYC